MVRKRGAKPGRIAVLIAAGWIAGMSIVGTGSASGFSKSRPTTQDTLMVRLPGTLFGAYVEPRGGWMKQDVQTSILDLEQRLGRTLDIDHHFYRWDLPFPSWKETWDHDHGRTTLISWAGAHVPTINGGGYDAMIQQRAAATAALPYPVLLRWFGEMNAAFHETIAVSPTAFVKAWRRIHSIFAARGADNVQWVWCPTAHGFDAGTAAAWYPGDGYVDWICADGYNWAPGKPGAKWTSFETTFSNFHAWAAPHGKPLLIAETGTEERAPGEKAAWIAAAADTIMMKYPEIKAFVYFDALEPDFSGREYDWRVDSSVASFDAYRDMGAEPFFRPAWRPLDVP